MCKFCRRKMLKKATAVKIKSHQNQRSFFQTSKNQQDQKNHFTRCKKSEKIKQNQFSNVKFNKESKVQTSNKMLNLVPKVVGMLQILHLGVYKRFLQSKRIGALYAHNFVTIVKP